MHPGSVVAGALLGVLVACGTSSAFTCVEDEQCGDGTCQQDVGYCSFIDDVCPSGERFGEFAGDGLALECVTLPGTTGPEPTTTTTTTTTGPEPTTTGLPVRPCGDDWWHCDWSMRMALDVTWAGTALPGFPVRVSLNPERIDPAALAREAADVRFVADSGLLVPHEIEWLSAATGQAELWVRMPSLEEGARVWMYWGNETAPDAQASRAVWAADFDAVWHLGPELLDSREEHHLEGVGTLDFEGQIGRARLFSGMSLLRPFTQERFVDLFEGGGTISAWILPLGYGQNGFGRIIDNATSNQANGGWYFSVSEDPEALRFSMQYASGSPYWETEPGTIELDRWHHVAVTHVSQDDGDVARLYLDGIEVALANDPSPTASPRLDSPMTATIGAMATGDLRFFDGMIDELRLSTSAREPEWIAAEYLSSVDLLLEYGPAELVPPA